MKQKIKRPGEARTLDLEMPSYYLGNYRITVSRLSQLGHPVSCDVTRPPVGVSLDYAP